MNHIAAALLISLSGKKVEKKGIEDILAAAGSKPNPVIVEAILNATKNKKPEDIVKEGLGKLCSSSGVSVSAPTSTAPVEAKKEEKKDDKKDAGKKDGGKKEEKKKPDPEPEDEDVGFGGLF